MADPIYSVERQGGPPGIRIGDGQPASIFYVAQPIDGATLQTLLSTFDIDELPRPGKTAGADSRRILGLTPRRWWLLQEAPAPTEPYTAALDACFTVAVDVSDAWTRLRIGGPATLDLLAKGSALDLDHRVFTDGSCALAAFAQLHTLLHRADGGKHFDLYCGRSHARYLREWLIEAAAEFGCEAPIEKGGEASATTT